MVGAVEELETERICAPKMDTIFFGPSRSPGGPPPYAAQGRGAILQMSSMGGQLSPPGLGAYRAAKFALEGVSSRSPRRWPRWHARPHRRARLVPHRVRRRPSCTARAEIDAYAETVGPTRAFIERAWTPPRRATRARPTAAILDALDAPDPPLRLALGGRCVAAIRGSKHERLRADLDAMGAREPRDGLRLSPPARLPLRPRASRSARRS